MKKSELRELVAKWKDLKRRSKNHDLSEKIRLIEHQYYHETGRKLEDELGEGQYDLVILDLSCSLFEPAGVISRLKASGQNVRTLAF